MILRERGESCGSTLTCDFPAGECGTPAQNHPRGTRESPYKGDSPGSPRRPSALLSPTAYKIHNCYAYKIDNYCTSKIND
jgi:hypothetical protein